MVPGRVRGLRDWRCTSLRLSPMRCRLLFDQLDHNSKGSRRQNRLGGRTKLSICPTYVQSSMFVIPEHNELANCMRISLLSSRAPSYPSWSVAARNGYERLAETHVSRVASSGHRRYIVKCETSSVESRMELSAKKFTKKSSKNCPHTPGHRQGLYKYRNFEA